MIRVYEEFAESSRRQILAELVDGSKNVRELVSATQLKQPNLSSHLARMREKGILTATKTGREVYYSFATPEIKEVVSKALAKQLTTPCHTCLDEASQQYAKAAVNGDENDCSEILDSLFAAKTTMIGIYQGLIMPAMRYVGYWYSEQKIDAAQEHMASAITERMMMRIVQHFATSKKVDRTAILGCGPGSFHVIGLRMASDYLRICGWKTLFLGGNVPHRCFISQVSQHKPDVVLLSCKAEDGLASDLELIGLLNAIRTKEERFCIGVGGCCAGKHRDEFLAAGADFISTDLETFANEVVPCIEKKGKAPKLAKAP